MYTMGYTRSGKDEEIDGSGRMTSAAVGKWKPRNHQIIGRVVVLRYKRPHKVGPGRMQETR